MADDEKTEEPKKIRMAPEEIEIGEEEGFEGHDLFGYAEFGEALGNIFQRTLGLRVVLLDDQWGSGKTVFVKQWAGHMRQRKANVIYIDAFENDYQSDPFLMIVTELTSKLTGTNAAADLIEASVKAVGSILSSAIRLNTAGLVDAEKISGLLRENLNEAEVEKKNLVNFRQKLGTIATEDGQIIVIIDELDRCRPDFALRLLERVKHLFDVEGVTFLLVASSSTLAQMVKHAYGFEDTQANLYLEKFMNFRVSLPKKLDGEHENRREKYSWLLAQNSLDDDPLGSSEYHIYEALGRFAEHCGADLRTIEKIYFNFIAAFLGNNFDSSWRKFWISLCFVKVMAPREFEEILRTGQCDWDSLSKPLNLTDYESRDGLSEGFSPIFRILYALFAPIGIVAWRSTNLDDRYSVKAEAAELPFPTGEPASREKLSIWIASMIEKNSTFL